MKARCPVCDDLVGIAPTKEKQVPDSCFSSEWQRIDMHAFKGQVCEGSGKKV